MSIKSENEKVQHNDEYENIEIVTGDSCVGALLRSGFEKEKMYTFYTNLSYQQIENVSEREDMDFTKIIELKDKVSKNQNLKIRIWSSRKSPSQYLFFIYICSIINSNNVSVIFSDKYDKNCYSIGCMTPREIKQLLKFENKLSKEETEMYKKEWENIKKENSELRLIKNNKITSISCSDLDKDILNKLEHIGEVKLIKAIGILLSQNNYNYESEVYLFLLRRFIEKGKIKVKVEEKPFWESVILINKNK